jgi:hypothetical protein
MTLIVALPETLVGGWQRPERAALRTCLAYAGITGLLFTLGYGGANWLASQQGLHHRFYWDAELTIPLVPQAIWVYLSINLVFLLPVFRLDSAEMHWLGQRMIAATVIATFFFLVMPTTIGFPRLDVSDGSYPAFALLYMLDQPYNCVPSLHVAYSALIMLAVARRAGAALRLGLGAWFLAIVTSTLLTHQHHLIDAAAALLLVALLSSIRQEAKA